MPLEAPLRVLAVGDAAGFVEPFTGEGMGWALVTGRAAAGMALDAVHGRIADHQLTGVVSTTTDKQLTINQLTTN